jgi:hypothetical protein
MHHVDGVPCAGVGAAPAPAIDVLEAAAIAARQAANRLSRARQAAEARHAELRLNYPLDPLWRRLGPECAANGRADKLARRLKRAIGADPYLWWTVKRRHDLSG